MMIIFSCKLFSENYWKMKVLMGWMNFFMKAVVHGQFYGTSNHPFLKRYLRTYPGTIAHAGRSDSSVGKKRDPVQQ